MTRIAMWLLLAVVAGAAAVLSFASLRDLAILCGLSPSLAWLLPVVVDAGAAAGCLVWLGGDPAAERVGDPASHCVGDPAAERGSLSFARSLTVVLLVSSVAGNAVVHYLASARLAAPWWLVVAVSATAPAVLGAVTHLVVLVGQSRTTRPVVDAEPLDEPTQHQETPGSDPVGELIESGAGRRRLAAELGISEHAARQLLSSRNGSEASR